MSAVMWATGILLSLALLAWPLWSKNVLGILLRAERISLFLPHEEIFPRTNHCSLRKPYVTLLLTEVFLISLVPPWVHSPRLHGQLTAVWNQRPEQTFWLKASVPHIREEVVKTAVQPPKTVSEIPKAKKTVTGTVQPRQPARAPTMSHQGLQHAVHEVSGPWSGGKQLSFQ